MPKARVISSKVVFRGPLFSVTSEQVREPAGYTARRDIVRHRGSVVIMPVSKNRDGLKILLEKQYRHAAGGDLWELPAGKIDGGESALAAGKRELLEETGYTARRWRKILHFYVSPGFLDETMTIFLASEIRAGQSQPEADEAIFSKFVSLPQALRMIRRGHIRDAKTIAPVFWLALRQRR